MKQYKMTLSEDQLKTILSALELKGRIGIGQFNEIWWQLDKRITHDRSIESLADMLAIKLGLKNRSIGNEQTHVEVKRCWDIFQVLRKKVHDDNAKPGDSYSVWSNDPLFTTDVGRSPPKIELVSDGN